MLIKHIFAAFIILEVYCKTVMARLGCLCGNSLSNSDCPSANILEVYYKDDVAKQIAEDPRLSFWDYYCEDRNYLFWYCQYCKRVHVQDMRARRMWRVYNIIESNEVDNNIPTDEWQEIYVISDVDRYKITEEDINDELLLSEFVKKANFKYTYFVSPDKRKIVAFDKDSKNVAFAYSLEVEYFDAINE